MIRINLIPKKVSKKKMGLVQHLIFAGVAFLLVAGGIGYVWMGLNAKLTKARREVAVARQEKEKLKDVHNQKTKYETNINSLKSQLDVIAKIKEARFLPVRLLDDLTNVLDKKTPVWLESFNIGKANAVKMDGYSLSNPDLAAFVTKMEKTPFYKDVDLLYSEKKKQQDREIYRFSITANSQTTDDPVPSKATV